jgi:hypothetical protein
LEHCIVWIRDLDNKKIGAEVFGELRNVMLKENGEDKMTRKVIIVDVFEHTGEKRTLLNNILQTSGSETNWLVDLSPQ